MLAGKAGIVGNVGFNALFNFCFFAAGMLEAMREELRFRVAGVASSKGALSTTSSSEPKLMSRIIGYLTLTNRLLGRELLLRVLRADSVGSSLPTKIISTCLLIKVN